jgi:hypothetical protein
MLVALPAVHLYSQARPAVRNLDSKPVAKTGGPDSANAHGITVAIALYDVIPESKSAFEQKAAEQLAALASNASFVNGRLLRNMDTTAAQYALYVKFSSRRESETALAALAAGLRSYCRRDAETHIAVLGHSYSPSGDTATPTGVEFGTNRTGQVAHLGLFVPFPSYREEYDKVLHETKMLTIGDKPRGYIGEDVLSEPDIVPPTKQTPYSPRAREETRMSFNYGEYNTMQDAEDSYIAREEKNDPKLVTMERIFYSSLQVPTRFYIFQVTQNISGRNSASAAQDVAHTGGESN